MAFEKRHLLLVIAIVCLVLWYFGSENIPYLKYLPLIAGAFNAFNLVATFAQQPNHEQFPTSQSDSQSKSEHDTDAR